MIVLHSNNVLMLKLVACLAFSSYMLPAMTASVGIFSNGSDFTVPPDPLQFREESEAQRSAWRYVEEQCTPIVPLEIWNDDTCHAALNSYFLNEPVWAYSTLNYYDRSKGLRPLPVKGLNSRPRILRYSFADFVIDEVPLWRDIFDGNIKKREELFLKVFLNPVCKELSTRESEGIQKDKAELCSARELYKYAAYLDGCVVALQRMNILVNPPSYSGIQLSEKSSVYEVVQNVIAEKIVDVSQRTLAQQRLDKGFLHSVWMLALCSETGYTMLPDIEVSDTMETPKTLFWRPDNIRFFQRVNYTHDIILKIAAKSGDPWAIQSYPLGIFTSSEFNADVQAQYPILMHRHLGSPSGWFRSELTFEERAQHQAQVYVMLYDIHGAKYAPLEIDPTELDDEIKYVVDGGPLKFPRSQKEVLENRATRHDNQRDDEILQKSGINRNP